ncbi:MAG: hypothetical protein JXA20_06630 [Spirochaetes bacterium]|nr:hypothetical protein [Spirochaetota bacterium]
MDRSKNRTVGIMTGRIITEVGPEELWNSLFLLLEEHFPDAKRMLPVLMKSLRKGKVKPGEAKQAGEEMALVSERLKSSPSKDGGRSLYGSLVTTTGRNIIDELIDSFSFSQETGCDVKVVTYGSVVDTAFL